MDAAIEVVRGAAEDPNEDSVGLGELPNEDGVVQLCVAEIPIVHARDGADAGIAGAAALIAAESVSSQG